MLKIAIVGKANSGKDTLAEAISHLLSLKEIKTKQVALADPIKKIIKIMYPETDNYILYGPSDNRKKIIPNSFLDGQPLTYRKLLQNLGTDVGRSYNENIWLDIVKHKLKRAKNKYGAFIVKDCRLKNEFDYLKRNDFYMIKIFRDNQLNLNHQSETEQDHIRTDEFNSAISNNGSLQDLNDFAGHIITSLMIK